MELKGKKVLILGAARSGLAAAHFLLKQGSDVYLNDIKPLMELPLELAAELEELASRGAHLILGAQPGLDEVRPELVIVSPGVPLTVLPILQAKERAIPVWGELELGYRYTKAALAVITGTNGKTTTTALTGQIMSDGGRNTFIAGNIGIPFISKAEELAANDVAVLEASSFQLESTHLFKPKVAVILNLTPDHLDRHGSFQGYIAAKAKIFANQDAQDWLILNWDDEETRKLAACARGRVIFYSSKHILKEGFCVEDGFLTVKMQERTVPIIDVEEVFIKGSHNLENALAALGVGWLMGIRAESLKKSLRSFPGVEHRQEHVLTLFGVDYINDSKGTNPDASIKALETYRHPIVLIAGGKSKGTSFASFAEKIKERVKKLILVGQSADELEEAVRRVGFTSYEQASGFADAVEKARQAAQSGDVVLLSPACASFDMFKNFEQRGEVFKQLVREMAQRYQK